MLSMCGLLCRMLRGWRHSEAVMLMAKALSQPHSSLLVQDILASDSGIVKVNEPSCTSLFCQNSNEGSVGQLLWRDNNKQAVVIAPKQRVDLKRWTLFMMAADQLSNSHGRESAQQASENGFPSAKPEVTTTITVLLEASYREQEDNQLLDCYVMVEQLSQPYAWKARDVFGIIVTTTPPQLLAMIQAFFNNALIVDDDFLITKIITVDLVGQPSTFDDPLSIPESVTPGPWTTERASCTQMELARSVSPTNYTVGQLSVREGDLMGACGISLHPPTLSAVLRQQSSAESATDTSTTLHPQSSSDSDKRASSLDPQSSYDSVSDYPTSDTDDLSCNVYNFYPRGWAVSGQQVVSGQPLSVRGVLNQLEGKQYRKPCSIVSNPMEDLWQESDDKTKVVDAGNVYQHGSLRCMNGPSGFSRRSEALLKVQSGSSECSYPYQCIPGKVICQNIQYSAPGKAEQEIVKEAAEYYQRAVSSAQERREWAKKSLSSTSEDDGPPCKFSFSDTKEKAVVTQEPKRQPVRINSEADLSRATNIIKENLANIVENYLVKHGSSEYQHLVSRAKTNDDRNLETDTHSGSQGVNVNVRDKVIHTTTSRVLNDQYEVTKTQDVQQISISISFEDDEKLVTEIIGGRDEGLVSVVDTKKAPVEGFSAEEISGYLTKREEYPHKPVEEDQSPVLSPVEGSGVCKSTGRSEKKLVKSEELLPPTMKRESCIDIPNNDDEFRSVTRFEDQSIQERAWLEKEELPGSLIVKSEAVINISETFIGNGNFDEPSRNNEKMLEMLQLHKNDLIEAPDTKKEDTSEELIDLEIESKLKEKELAEVSKSPTLKECFQIIESHKKEEKVSNIEEVVHTDNVDTTSTENVDSSRIKDIDQSLAGNDNKYTDIPIILDSVQENIAVNEKRNQKLSLISEIEENGDGTHLEIQEKGQVDEVSDDDSSQKPRCLKEIHKLNTKSSTTSESSFESLPYRMLSSQPDSLNDDLGLVIELTSAPIDSEKALAAKRELIRQERMAAMSLMSGTLLESRDEIRSEAIFEKGSEFETVDAEKCSDVDAVHEEENLEMNAMAAAASTQEEDRESYPSSLFDSGVDIVMHEHVSSINSSLSKSLVSPVESAAESGFSSLKEPLVPEGAMVEDSGPGEHRGVCLSKSKDSLDLTDTDKFPGTDTLSDDMETLSSNAGDITLVESGPVSKEGSARGSVSDGIYQDNGYLRYGSESSHLDLDSVGIPNTYLKGSHYEATAAIEDMSGRDELPPNAGGDQLTQQNLMRHAEKTSISTDIVDYCNRLQKLSLDYVKASSSEKFDQKSAKYLPDDSETSKRKTSESISSEDTVISKVSAEEQNNKIQSQGSQEDQMELPESLQECSEYEDLNKTGDYDVGMENGEPCKSPVSHIAINGKISISSGEGIELKERYSAVTPTVPLGADQECDIAVEGKSEENERLLDMKNRSEITEQKADESVHKEGSINGSSLAGSVERKHSSVGHKSRGSTLTSSTSQSEEIPRDATVADKALGQENYSPKDSTRHVFPDAAKQSSQSEKTSMSSAEKESNIQPVHATETEKSRKSNKSKSEVSDKSSPNARETCSNSDRPSRHSSRSGVSDLEDEVFLPPSENYIFDGRPVIYCPKIDMADQIGIEHPQVAMSVFAVIPSKEIKSGKDGRWEEHMGKGSAFKMADYYAAQDSKIQKEEKDKPLVVSEFRKISEGFTVVEDNILIEEGQSKAQIESDTSEESVEWKNKTAEIKAPLRCIGGAPLTDDYTHIEGTEIEPVANVQEELKTTKTDSEGWTPSKDSANANKMDNEALGEGKMEEGSDTKGTCKAAREIHPAVRSKRADGGGQSNLKNGEEVHSSQTILKSGVSDIESKSHRESAIYDDRVRSYESEWVIAADGHTIINPVFQESPISPFTTQTNNLIEESPKPSDYRVFDLSKPAIDEASDHSKPKLARMANLERSDTSMAIQRVSDMEVLPVNKVAIKILDNDESVPQSPILSPLSPKFSCKTNSTSFSGVKEAVAVAEETITRRRTGSDANDHTISDKANEKRLNTSKREGKVFDFDKVPDLEECKSQGTGSLKSKESEESEISNVTSNEDYSAKSEPEMKTEGDERLSTQTLDEQRSVSKGDIRSGWAVGGSLERLERTSSSKEGKGHHQGSISSAKSEDLGMKCEKVSLKSQGSLDKFPHFDQISAQQKARGARKKVLSVDTEGKDKLGKEKSKEMHRSATLPVGSLSVKKEDKKKEKDEKVKKKKKEKEVGVVEKKSAMSSLKGLLKRSKPKEKEKEKDKEKDKDSSSQEKLSSPSLFRKFERKSRSNTHSPLLDDKKNSSQGLRETASSNPNLQRCGSPFIRGVSHSSSFTSSPFRRPHSSTAVFSPAKRVMSSVSGLSPPGESSPGMPLMRVEEEGPCRKNLDVDTGKPPNVLVYAANKADYFEAVRDTLVNCLNQDRYTVYQLTDEMAFKSPWAGSTTLLVVCGDVPAHVSTVFIRYLLQGGRVLSICSDFLNVAVPLFGDPTFSAMGLETNSYPLEEKGTVEVQEQAVVSISYRRWSSVQLLHHQHCFHSSPKNKRFSQDLEKTSKKVSRSAVSVEPTHVEITDECGGQHRLNLSILATDDTWGAPSLLSARLHGGNGKAVFSQVHLERDPQECFGALNVPSKLSVSNEARLEILRDLLNSELSMDTTGSSSSCVYTAAYFLGRHELKQDLLNKLQPHLENQELKRPQLILQFVNAREIAKQADEDLLPLLMNACPMTFSTVRYFETLKTTAIGRLVIYCDVMTSSMKVIAGHPPLIHGITVVPTQQTQGKGRSGNTWLSPLGCAMFSTQLHIPLSSNLGQHLPFLQHLVAIAIVQAVREYPGYGDIPLNLKWPNDIYIAGDTKVGGVIVEATTIGKEVIANVGCGINLSNSNPTYCINDAVRQHNKEHKTSLPEIDRETFLARVFNHFEGLIDTFQTDGPEAVCPIYYKYWLHSNAVVTVQNENRCIENAVITGVDNYGFLEAHLVDGTMITLQPDGNSFDMMEGLIYSKIH
ncbi:uncharacterized protein LOC122255619 isoform X5 [Penaeus japonicus]|uniref:uncharacterized protein LOC122255619 isoform X5 n=1 Tax=Penaeus japonicus TaxID=27405 RepID=UPI001C7153BB|nr:uncharacterized protein LOC122255619 isoform X5 [Penaeus japonicus]